MTTLSPCPHCQAATPADVLEDAVRYVFWKRPNGACPACVQHELLTTLLREGDEALHRQIQTAWPLDAEAAFGALPTPLRLHADPRFAGRGVTIVMIDSGFYPHPDLVQPINRIRAWVDAGKETAVALRFKPTDTPTWPQWNKGYGWQWHGLMTSVTSAGNGYLSHGLYRGLANEAELVLIQVRDKKGAITNESITRALRWVKKHGAALGVRVVNLSVAGDPTPGEENPVETAVAELVMMGVVVTAAAGNDGVRQLVPPASAPHALTIGGLDDKNDFDHDSVELWHSNYGRSSLGGSKPELVAPSIWVVAPVLPNSGVAKEAQQLFARRNQPEVEERLRSLKLVTPHYQHVDGTSFAAPLVASTVACMFEANPALTPLMVRHILQTAVSRIPGVATEKQGAGALEAGRAVVLSLQERHAYRLDSPQVEPSGITFSLHDHATQQVQVWGSWDSWRTGLPAREVERGVWQTEKRPIGNGRYFYKFLLNGTHWLDDPANPHKVPDGYGGFNTVVEV